MCAQTASPVAKGLFQKGIAMSGEYNSLRGVNTTWQAQDCKSRLPTLQEAGKAGERFAAALGCEAQGRDADRQVAACLRRIPAKTLLDKAGNGMAPDQGTLGPIVDGEILTMSPAEAFEKGRVNKVTLIHGVDRDETQMRVAETPEEYEALVKEQYGPLAREVFERYPLKRFPAPAPYVAFRTILADSNSVCPSLLNNERLSRHITVFGFVNANADAPPASFVDQSKPNGAFHVNENQFLQSAMTNASANQQTLGNQLVAQWTGFARTGDPTVDGTPYWSKYTRSNPAVMSLAPAGDSVMTTEIAKQHNCGFWNRYAPFD
ncbi:hypothetical protein Ssi03_02640 [Sphaerisporangium siamense]|uniref:Carboxylesterase type B n=1 Tax=Sphaerisporangium siamense TaxID=795645 RepID=A0A7W7DD38_9ACTN|nr:carboxylesterase type B [Sphaerisporangium siamense]GII82274.1 hypothetical protein Ssi03_02640 [Sphaerisporangium siamense]